jgi:hypothetical protein
MMAHYTLHTTCKYIVMGHFARHKHIRLRPQQYSCPRSRLHGYSIHPRLLLGGGDAGAGCRPSENCIGDS